MTDRFFLRRAAAVIIDVVWGTALFTILLLLANSYLSPQILPPQLGQSQSCQQVALTDARLADQVLPLADGEQHVQLLCMVQDRLFASSHYVTRLVNVKDQQTTTHFVSYASDVTGHGLAIVSTGALVRILLPLLFALFLAKSGLTPGKRLMQLKVTRRDGGKVTLSRALIREYCKFLPLVIISLPGLLSAYQQALRPGPESQAAVLDWLNALAGGGTSAEALVGTMAAVSLVVGLASLAYWLLPFLRWRGQTPWDRFTGTQVAAHASPLIKAK